MRNGVRHVSEAAATWSPYALDGGTPAGEIALLRQRNTENEDLFVGLYHCAEALEGTDLPYPHDESFIVLDGEASITLSDGVEHVFKTGDLVTIAKGETAVAFRQSPGFKKFFVLSD
jgi:uncharacterized cupin superfamily protein